MVSKFKVLVVAGYHKEDEEFGRAVLEELIGLYSSENNDNYREQFNESGNVAVPESNIEYYVIKGRRRAKPGDTYKAVDREIGDKACDVSADLVIDIHSSPSDEEKKHIKWLLQIQSSLRDSIDYVWYSDFIKKRSKEGSFSKHASLLDPNQVFGFGPTWLAIQAYLGSVNGRDSTSDEERATAEAIKNVITSYRKFRGGYDNNRRGFKHRIDRQVGEYSKEWIDAQP